jgi:hypothetical protein
MRLCKHGRLIVLGLVSLLVVGPVWAQQKQQPPSVLPGKPDEGEGALQLGEWFESKIAGIALRVPAGGAEIRRAGVPDLIVEFVNDKQGTILRISKLEFREPRQLADVKGIDGTMKPGIMSDVASAFLRENPMADALRNEVSQIRGREVGQVAFRFSVGTSRRFMQEAIICYNETYYYQITMTSPAAKKSASGGIDPQEKQAADLFAEMIDSVQLIDRTQIAKDQEERLLRTRDLLEQIKGPKIAEKALVPEQWLRLTRDGKDIGYTYVVEERAKEDGREGILISVRSRSVLGADNQVDVASRMFISDSWKHESWTHEITTQAGKKIDTTSELGMSDRQEKYRLDTSREFGDNPDPTDPKQPPVRKVQKYTLEVRTQIGKTSGKPVTWELPEWYLPQVIGHLLPRMLPLEKPQTYMFVAYVSDTRQLMNRYVDVCEPKEISFNGQKVLAIAVKDRIGIEGVPTTYFITPAGQCLGSETQYRSGNTTSVIRVLPSDQASLRRVWDNARLDKPDASRLPMPRDTAK